VRGNDACRARGVGVGIVVGEKEEEGTPGNDLLSHAVTHVLPSALTSLTTGFGMGPGVSSSLKSPKIPSSLTR
jgi:hypothetical protein